MTYGCGICGTNHPPAADDQMPDANCPPCQCVWCRYHRGETNDAERQMIESRTAAIAKNEARRAARAMSNDLGAALRRYFGKDDTP